MSAAMNTRSNMPGRRGKKSAHSEAYHHPLVTMVHRHSTQSAQDGVFGVLAVDVQGMRINFVLQPVVHCTRPPAVVQRPMKM